jgi:hypothetical protein
VKDFCLINKKSRKTEVMQKLSYNVSTVIFIVVLVWPVYQLAKYFL